MNQARVRLGVIEFHGRLNPGLPERFHAVTEDLRASASIVDVWLMDIAAVLKEYGYDMRIYGSKLSDQDDNDGSCPDGQHT